MHGLKLAMEFALIFLLIYLNLRGTRESVLFLLPIFLLFVVVHVFAIGLGILPKAGEVPLVASTTYRKDSGRYSRVGLMGDSFYRSACI
jgi:membrane-bound ClpP family serine protease